MTNEDLEAVGKGLEPPKPGTYQAKVIQADPKKPAGKGARIEVIYEITKGDHKGFKLFDYLAEGEASKWKRDQFWVAAGLVTGSGKNVKVLDLDPAKVHKLPDVLVRVGNHTYEDEIKADVKGVYPLPTDSDDADAAEEGEEAEAAEGADDGEEIDLDAMSKDELIEFAEENEIEIPKTKKTTAAIRSFIASELEEEAPEEEAAEDPEAEAADPEEEEVDLSELSLKELRALAEENDVEHEGLKRAALETALEEALGGEEEPESEEGEAQDYASWDLADIKEELKSRDIKPLGPKSKLIKLLEESDKTGGV